MPTIRIPEETRPLHRFVETNLRHEEGVVFSTYAHMMVFCACVGFEIKEFRKNPAALAQPTPIDLAIITHNSSLQQAALLLGLAHDRSDPYVTNEERLCEIIEGYAAAGAAFLIREFEQCGWKEIPSTLHAIVKNRSNGEPASS